jgi:ankyrin repeat protein
MAVGDDTTNPSLPRDLRAAWRLAGEAIGAGDDGALRRALTDRPDLATTGFISMYLLFEAVRLGRASAVGALLDAGVPVDEPNEQGGTALMTAAWNGHAEVVRRLLAAGADPDAASEEDGSYGDPGASGRCALWGAVYKGHREVIDLLEPVTSPELRARAYEAAAERHNVEFEDALPYAEETRWLLGAARRGELESLADAIEAGGDVNVRLRPEESHRALGGTPLSCAAGRGRMDLVEVLLAAGADSGLRGHDGRTAADLAEQNGHAAIAAMLRSAPRPPEDAPGDVRPPHRGSRNRLSGAGGCG